MQICNPLLWTTLLVLIDKGTPALGLATHFHFRHFFRVPPTKPSKRNKRPRHDGRPPRFVQQVENKFIGDDGRVTPVLNIHAEIPERLWTPDDQSTLRALREGIERLKGEEKSTFELNKGLLAYQHRLMRATLEAEMAFADTHQMKKRLAA